MFFDTYFVEKFFFVNNNTMIIMRKEFFIVLVALHAFASQLFGTPETDLSVLNKAISKMEYCGPFAGEIAMVRQNGKWGTINRKGELLVDCKYDLYFNYFRYIGILPETAEGFYGFWMEDTTSHKRIYCDKNAQCICPPTSNEVFSYLDYHDCVVHNGEKACLYHDGKLLIDTLYPSIVPIKAGEVYYSIQTDQDSAKWKNGLVNSKGKILIPLSDKYEEFYPLWPDEPYLVFRDFDSFKLGVMTVNGKVILPAEYNSIDTSQIDDSSDKGNKHLKYVKVVDGSNRKTTIYSSKFKKMFEIDDQLFGCLVVNNDDDNVTFTLMGNEYNLNGKKIASKPKPNLQPQPEKPTFTSEYIPEGYSFYRFLGDDFVEIIKTKPSWRSRILNKTNGKLSPENGYVTYKKDHFLINTNKMDIILDLDFNVVESDVYDYRDSSYYITKKGDVYSYYNTKRERLFKDYEFDRLRYNSRPCFDLNSSDSSSHPDFDIVHSMYANPQKNKNIEVVREKKSGKWGVIDVSTEKVIVPFVIDEMLVPNWDKFYQTNVEFFSDGLIPVRIKGRWYYVDADGNGLPAGLSGK